MPLRDVHLDDKFDLGQRRVFVTGYQALVRLCLMQKELDRRNGLNTAGFVTGYRGSPLGGLDGQFIRAKPFLDKSDIRFQGGINEDLAATAVWGSQQAELRGEGKFDGVFAMWYGKGPGVDRTGDVFRHANNAGSAKHGGVLALMGDDHTAESSTTAHQSEYHFIDVMIPILNPAGVQEVLDYGLYGWAMSRFTGAWTALKTMHETIESTAAIDASLERINIVIPERLPDAARRAQYPAQRSDPGAGSPPARLQARRHARLRARQQAQPHHHLRRPQSQDRHHHHRQELSRRPPGVRRTRHRRNQMQRARHPAVQDRLRLADQPAANLPTSPAASILSSSSRRSARCSKSRSAKSFTAPPISRSASASATRTATGCFRSKARSIPTRSRSASATGCLKYHRNDEIAGRVARLKELQRAAAKPPRTSPSAFRISAPAVRTTPRPSCPKACAPMPASAVITWRSGWTARRSASPIWAARAPTGSARRRSPTAATCSRISATAPTIIPATWRSARRSRRTPTSPTRSCSTTRWR